MRRMCVVVVAALLLSACGSGESPVAVPSAAPSETELSEQQRKEIREKAGIPEEPSPAVKAKYVAALNAIDADIVHGKPDKAVSRGRDTCSSVKESPKATAKLVKLTSMRFTSPDHPEGRPPAMAKRILKVVRKYICPDF